MKKLVIAVVLGIVVSTGTSFALTSTVAPADLTETQSILTGYGDN